MKTILGRSLAIMIGVLLSCWGCGLQEYPHHAARGSGGNGGSGGRGGETVSTGGESGGAETGGSGGEPAADAGAKDGPVDQRRDAATAPPSPGIDINGTHVPRERAIVFIHFGHSNMAGLA